MRTPLESLTTCICRWDASDIPHVVSSTFHHFPPHRHSSPPKRTSQHPQGSFLGIPAERTPGLTSGPDLHTLNVVEHPLYLGVHPQDVVVVAQDRAASLWRLLFLQFPTKINRWAMVTPTPRWDSAPPRAPPPPRRPKRGAAPTSGAVSGAHRGGLFSPCSAVKGIVSAVAKVPIQQA